MSDLPGFLLARIAENETAARQVGAFNAPSARMNAMTGGGAMVVLNGTSGPFDPARVLAECEAKRRIVGMCVPSGVDDEGNDFYVGGYGEAYVETLGYLALPYADHPDYREEWKP